MHNPARPGEVLHKYLPEGLGMTEAARRLGITRQALSAVLKGRADVSAEMALRLEAALGTTAEMCARAAGAIRRPSELEHPVARRQPACAREVPAGALTAALVLHDPPLLQGSGAVEATPFEFARHVRRGPGRGATRTP